MYFERCLLDTEHPRLWNPSDYVWQWSTPKRAEKKEQLPAFVGRHKETNTKSFAWHGQGENQLHFSGEGDWWPEENSDHRLDFQIPNSNQKVDFETLAVWLSQLPVGDIEASNEVPILSDNNGGTAFPT